MDEESAQDQAARVDKLWARLDVDKKGALDLKALKKGLEKIDHPLKNADNLMNDILRTVDLNHDGKIQYNEFCTFVRHAELELWKLFKTIDKDANNKLSKDELRSAFSSAGLSVSNAKLDAFFDSVDRDHDGLLSFEEWRDFLLFIPSTVPGLRAVMSFYNAGFQVNQEGDVHLSDEAINSIGITIMSPFKNFLGLFIRHPAPIRHRPPDNAEPPIPPAMSEAEFQEPPAPKYESPDVDYVPDVESSALENAPKESKFRAALTALLPSPGYFVAGGLAGMISRTTTAPLDRLKVYLIAQIGTQGDAIDAAKKGAPLKATKHAARPLIDASVALWKAGGMRSLFAGNGLNVAKVMPESAIKFGSYEASKRFFATIEGHRDPTKLHPWSQFAAGGLGGIISQFAVYPMDTLKFRMQCETVEGGLYGNQLIVQTLRKMWATGGIRSFYRGLTMGLVGMFPYSAIDLTTFEYTKRWIMKRNARIRGCHEDDAAPGGITTAMIGGFSGALGASIVYPLNLLRTRLQTQGTVMHRRTYTGIVDVTRQTIQGEGVRGLFKGITPNLLKVVPAVSITYVVYERAKKAMNLA